MFGIITLTFTVAIVSQALSEFIVLGSNGEPFPDDNKDKRNPADTTTQRIRFMINPKRSPAYSIPRSSLMISGRGFGPGFADSGAGMFHLAKRGFFDEEKRSGSTERKFIPRGGLMVSGRGFMPGFAEGRPTFHVKRNGAVDSSEDATSDDTFIRSLGL